MKDPNNKKQTPADTPLSADEKHQAESFFKMLVKKRYDVRSMGNILKHMGGLYLEWVKENYDD